MIITCRRYVLAVIIVAVLVICGGMWVPFAVGAMIRGVGPLRITTFSWILAGFLVILAKSRYVNEWPWHDFLRCQVVCRSFKDVEDVTGINAQIILMDSLHQEHQKTLIMKGSYNGPFVAQKDKSGIGFIIDEPIQLLTMLASGFVVLKVINEKGGHLKCINVRKGHKDVGLERMDTIKSLACLDVGNRSLRAKKAAWSPLRRLLRNKAEKVKRLKEEELRYSKVLGVYIGDSKFGYEHRLDPP